MPPSPMDRRFEVDEESRVCAKEQIREVYSDAKTSVLTYRQRDCVVQYICEV